MASPIIPRSELAPSVLAEYLEKAILGFQVIYDVKVPQVDALAVALARSLQPEHQRSVRDGQEDGHKLTVTAWTVRDREPAGVS